MTKRHHYPNRYEPDTFAKQDEFIPRLHPPMEFCNGCGIAVKTRYKTYRPKGPQYLCWPCLKKALI